MEKIFIEDSQKNIKEITLKDFNNLLEKERVDLVRTHKVTKIVNDKKYELIITGGSTWYFKDRPSEKHFVGYEEYSDGTVVSSRQEFDKLDRKEEKEVWKKKN